MMGIILNNKYAKNAHLNVSRVQSHQETVQVVIKLVFSQDSSKDKIVSCFHAKIPVMMDIMRMNKTFADHVKFI
jgi:hypothetical protein